jgi:hypothetical protein
MNANRHILFFILGLALGLTILSAASSAVSLNVTIVERGKIVSFYDQYYVYQLNGTARITNPTNTSLFNIELPFYLSTLDVRTNYSKTGNYMTPSGIFLYGLGPLASETFHYRLVGISTEDLSSNGRSVLANGIESLDPRIYSNLMGTLKKAPFEDPALTGHASSRLISVELRNPTDFDYTIAQVEVIKTPSLDPNQEIARWSFTGRKPTLVGGEGWDFDFIDQNATEGEVYWLSTDIYMDQIQVTAWSNISRYDQEDLFIILSNVTVNETANLSLPLLFDRVYLRKLVSKTLMVPGETVNITLIVNNLEPRDVSVKVTDPIPSGFDVLAITEGTVTGSNATWDITLPMGTAKRLRYSLRYTDEESLGLDYFKPAQLVYDGKTYYSQGVPFIRKYIPEKRIFVQKKVRFLSGEEVQVTLSLQNLGESPLENIMVKEYILSAAEFREISILPVERGLWRIERLNQSQTWETTYVTDKPSILNTLPEVYGVPKASVLQTIILSNEVKSDFKVISTRVAEVAAILILGLIIALYFVPANAFSRIRREQSRDLRVMSKELDSLKERTGGRSEEAKPIRTSGVLVSPPEAKHASKLESPERLARHAALEKTKEELERMKKDSKESGKQQETTTGKK